MTMMQMPPATIPTHPATPICILLEVLWGRGVGARGVRCLCQLDRASPVRLSQWR